MFDDLVAQVDGVLDDAGVERAAICGVVILDRTGDTARAVWSTCR
jgi:hypothetical protein